MTELERLDAQKLGALVQTDDLQELTVAQIFDLFREEKALHPYLPDATYEVDPRDGALVTFSSARARRPHDHAVPEEPAVDQACPICQGQTTGIIDVAPLSQGQTFINKNLFPILRVLEKIEPEALQQARDDGAPMMKRATYGLHFLQWTSSLHNCDWHNMAQPDRVTVLERLAALECKLLFDDHRLMPPAEPWDPQTKARGYVSIIKNYGAPVGGSLAHGHQQIAYSNIMPRRIHNNWSFFERRRETFAGFLQRENPDDLTVADYGEAVLLVPYFMRRPYNMMLMLADVRKQHLCQLDEAELAAVADGWHDAIRLIRSIMPQIGKPVAYNVITHNGPGAGLYFEFLPYTQETGGFEHLGLWVCQHNPAAAAQVLRSRLEAFNQP